MPHAKSLDHFPEGMPDLLSSTLFQRLKQGIVLLIVPRKVVSVLIEVVGRGAGRDPKKIESKQRGADEIQSALQRRVVRKLPDVLMESEIVSQNLEEVPPQSGTLHHVDEMVEPGGVLRRQSRVGQRGGQRLQFQAHGVDPLHVFRRQFRDERAPVFALGNQTAMLELLKGL